MDDKNTIQSVVLTLNSIEVRGAENLDKMLGCIVALERLLREGDKNG